MKMNTEQAKTATIAGLVCGLIGIGVGYKIVNRKLAEEQKEVLTQRGLMVDMAEHFSILNAQQTQEDMDEWLDVLNNKLRFINTIYDI